MVKWEDIFRSDAIILFVRNWRTLRSTDRFVKEIATRISGLHFRRFRYDSIFTANDRCIGCRGKPIRRLNKADPFSPLVYPRPCQIISPSLWRKSLGPRRLFRSNYTYIYIYICMCVSKTKTKKKRRRKDDGEGRIAERECSRVEGRGREGRERSRAERKHMPGRLVPRRSKPRIS